MKTWHAFVIGEDHTEFTVSVEANTKEQARDKVESLYPEASIQTVFDPIERAEDNYRRAQARYDNPDLDDFDY